MMNIMRETPSHEDVDHDQLRQMLDEARAEVDRITEASQSLRDMVDLMSVMFNEREETGPVDEDRTKHYRDIHTVEVVENPFSYE